MFNIFKRKKKTDNNEPVELPIEVEIASLIKNSLNKNENLIEIEFDQFSSKLKNIQKGVIVSLCNNKDIFPISILINKEKKLDDSFIEQLQELTKFEAIQYEYVESDYEETLWTTSISSVFSTEDSDYFIFLNKDVKVSPKSNIITIHHSREFLFGQLLIGDISIKGSQFTMSFDELDFTPQIESNENQSSFKSSMQINESNISFYYLLIGKNKYINQLVKELIKDQKAKLETQLSSEVNIINAGSVETDSIDSKGLFSLKGMIHTSGINVPFKFFFPKKLLNLFPEYICKTIKGKILQINKDMFRKSFNSFYKTLEDLLFSDLISIAEDRDLNLICQNFFLSNSINADKIRELFFYKVKLEEKSRILKLPFICSENFLNHLPVILREKFIESKSYSQSYEDLLDANRDILELIFKNVSAGKLLLSHKTRLVLEKELGSKEKENKTRRLRKLVGNKKYINYLSTIDGKKAQILLSNMKNILIVDTFIYQTEELVKLKPFLSKNRFKELREDISFTQGKIKTNQIDINRICDSIEKFNGYIKEFAGKEQDKEA